MRYTRKIASLLLALILVLSLATTAFADDTATSNTITINNAKSGETYTAYKMLDLSIGGTAEKPAYRYTVNSAWTSFFNDSTPDAAWEAVFAIDAQGYVTAKEGVTSESTWSATSDLSKFAEAAAKYVADSSPALTVAASGTVANGATSVVLTTTAPGYYLITSTLGTRAMVDTTPGDVAINEKNAGNTITKTVEEDSTNKYGEANNAQIGDTINFKTEVTIVPRSVNVKIHDTMDSGLTYKNDVKIYTDANCQTDLANTYYTIQATPDTGDTFTIVIDNTFASSAEESQVLYITYSATLNVDAVAVTTTEQSTTDDEGNETTSTVVTNVETSAQKNTTYVSYGNATDSEKSQTTTTTASFEVLKYAAGDDTKANLAGATFQLKKASTVINLIKIDDTNYCVAASSEANTVSSFTTVASGNIVIWGVDNSDSDYTLAETEAPEGYNKLSTDQNVNFSTDGATTVEIANNSGTELPSTGGMGTTLFYVVGSFLLLSAVVLLVTRKRMAA